MKPLPPMTDAAHLREIARLDLALAAARREIEELRARSEVLNTGVYPTNQLVDLEVGKMLVDLALGWDIALDSRQTALSSVEWRLTVIRGDEEHVYHGTDLWHVVRAGWVGAAPGRVN